MRGLPPRTVPRGGRRASLIGLVLVALAAVMAPVVSNSSVGAVDEQPWSLTAKPVAGLTDGQSVVMNAKTSTPDFPIYSAEAHVCRSGVAYQPSTDDRPSVDFRLGADNCPLTPISSSADAGVTANTYTLAPTPGGATFSLAVGIGVVKWTSTLGGEKTLTCDSANPCTLVVEILAGNPATWIPWTQQLTYQVDDPVAGCGGPAAGVVQSGASDRMSDAWVNWTLDACHKPGRKGALTTASFLSEGDAVQGFSSGRLDLAYSATGYNPAVNLSPETPKPYRSAVMVPVAVNATVLAVGNGQPGPGGHKIPYAPPKLTLDEVAGVLSGGQFGLSPQQEAAIAARNPEFDPALGGTTIYIKANGVYPVEGPAESESSSWIGTNYLKQLTPDAWRVPNLPLFGTDANKSRGADATLAQASPSFALALGLYSGRPSLRKALRSIGGFDFGGLWALTDLETATAVGLTPVSIANAAGEFVAPTAESVTAGVATMTAQADGTLLPSAAAAGPAGQPQPYPMTMVEYAMVPAEPLVDASGCARLASQALLTDWLTYVLGDGQKNLPPGMLPLPPALAATATQQLAKVGATASTATCTTPPPGTSTPSAVAAPTDLVGATNYSSSYGSTSTATSSGTSSDATAAPPAASAELAVASGPIPDYVGNSPASGLIGVAAMAGVLLLVFGAAAFSSGRGWSLWRSPPSPDS